MVVNESEYVIHELGFMFQMPWGVLLRALCLLETDGAILVGGGDGALYLHFYFLYQKIKNKMAIQILLFLI